MKARPEIAKILKDAFSQRLTRNPHYSMRAFARDLKLSSASLSLILSGKQGLSPAKAREISRILGLDEREAEYFCDLVAANHSRSHHERRLAQIRLRKHEQGGRTVDLEMFKVISDWYHLAILELTTLPGFESSTRWISASLGIPERTAEIAIGRLKELKLLEEAGGKLRRTSDFVATPSEVPSAAIKNYHSQIFKKADTALYHQSVDERDFSGVQFALAPEDLPWAKEQIKQFRRSLMAQLESNPKRDRVYCLTIGLFNLLQNPSAGVEEQSG